MEEKIFIKTCNRCKQDKDSTEFYKQKLTKDGLKCWCKECTREYNALYSPSNTGDRVRKKPVYNYIKTLKYNYGLSPTDYSDKLKRQKQKCAVCGEDKGNRRFCVDHNHETGQTRGILCSKCNHLVGAVENKNHESACKYIKKWNLAETYIKLTG